MARKVVVYVLAICFIIINFPLMSKAESVSKGTIKELIVKHSKEMGMDPALALSIAKAESGFSHDKKSKGGAIGVFQLMPSTAKRMGYNPYKLNDNIKGGITYYKKMYNMFGSTELALAAYNAGPGNVKRYNGIPPFSETKKFVSSIMNSYNDFKKQPELIVADYKVVEPDANLSFELKEAAFRMQQDAILNSFLSVQGI